MTQDCCNQKVNNNWRGHRETGRVASVSKIGDAMRKAILMIFMTAMSISAMAEWVYVSKINENSTSYVDPATLRKAGNRVKMWILIDYKTTKENVAYARPYLSLKGQMEYDCKEEKSQLLYFIQYSENMAGGEIVFTTVPNHPTHWRPVSPGSIDETLYKIGCEVTGGS